MMANSPMTVSKLEPWVVMDTLPVAGAVKEYQMERDALRMPGMQASPVSLVAPTVDADDVPAGREMRLQQRTVTVPSCEGNAQEVST